MYSRRLLRMRRNMRAERSVEDKILSVQGAEVSRSSRIKAML
jgi:hypothetical protein